MKLTHWQYLQSANPAKPVQSSGICHLDSITTGSRRLNCGYDPNRDYRITFTVIP